MNGPTLASVKTAYILKRYPRLTETFILNEVRAMERLGARLELFSLLPPEPPPHHPMVAEVRAPLHPVPQITRGNWQELLAAHLRCLARAPQRYGYALACAMVWSITAPSPRSVWKQFTRGGFVANRCRKNGVEHIHAHFANAPAAVARFASLLSGITYSFTAHAKDLYLTPQRVIQRRARAATFVATCTGYNASYLHRLLPETPGKVHLVYHGIDLAQFSQLAPARPRQASEHALILAVGRLVPKKGHEDLIHACKELDRRNRDFRCLIVGEGPLRAALQKQIIDLGLQDRVVLRGAMTHADLIALYREAAVFALAPKIMEDGDRDGIPNVIVEAMATGVPVVATGISGIPELVIHEKTGLLVPPDDPMRLADAIQSTLDDPAKAGQRAVSARQRLEDEFDLWRTTQRLHDLIGCEACASTETTSLVDLSSDVAAAESKP